MNPIFAALFWSGYALLAVAICAVVVGGYRFAAAWRAQRMRPGLWR